MAKGTTRKNARPDGERKTFEDLLYQVLETEELGGVKVYSCALRCAVHPELREDWVRYLSETRQHVAVARGLLMANGLDPDVDVPARMPIRTIGQSLVTAMEQGLAAGDSAAAQLTAADCVVEAETKDHHNWELLGRLAEGLSGDQGERLRASVAEIEEQEDRHLYHTAGWARELWLDALGLPAVLPPPEEVRAVDSAIGAAEAKKNVPRPRKGAPSRT